MVFALALATTSPAQTVTNFSSFSESGNLLTGTNTRQQSFTPSISPAGNVTVTSVSGSNVGQETYLTDQFPTMTTGDRISVSLSSVTFNNSADTIGLAIAGTELLTTRTNILVWGWRSGSMYLTNFDASGGLTTQTPGYPAAGRPDSVFIERTATGWTLGYIKGTTETISYTNIGSVGTTAITATGSAIGFWSDMRTNTSTWTLANLTRSGTPPPPPPPPPPTTDFVPLVSFIPVTDGNEATDENGYAGSATNSIAFIQDNLITVGNQQFITQSLRYRHVHMGAHSRHRWGASAVHEGNGCLTQQLLLPGPDDPGSRRYAAPRRAIPQLGRQFPDKPSLRISAFARSRSFVATQ